MTYMPILIIIVLAVAFYGYIQNHIKIKTLEDVFLFGILILVLLAVIWVNV